jgi:hypothetical protein
LYVRVENFGIKARSQKGFEKRDMPIILHWNTPLLCLHHNIWTYFDSNVFPLWFFERIQIHVIVVQVFHYYYCFHCYSNKKWKEQPWKATHDC